MIKGTFIMRFFISFFYYLFIKTHANVFDKVTFRQTDHCSGLRAAALLSTQTVLKLGILFLIPARNDKHVKIKLNCFLCGVVLCLKWTHCDFFIKAMTRNSVIIFNHYRVQTLCYRDKHLLYGISSPELTPFAVRIISYSKSLLCWLKSQSLGIGTTHMWAWNLEFSGLRNVYKIP